MLVVGQTALALVLLIGSALLVQSFQRLRKVDPGYETADIYTFQFAPEQDRLERRPSLGTAAPRLHGPAARAPRRDRGRASSTTSRSMKAPASGRFLTDAMSGRTAARCSNSQLHRRGLLPRHGHRAAAGARVHERRSRHAEQQRHRQPFGGRRSSGPTRSPGPADCAGLRRQGAPAFTVVGVVEDVKQNDWRDAGEAVVYFPLTGPTPARRRWARPRMWSSRRAPELLQRQVRELVLEAEGISL